MKREILFRALKDDHSNFNFFYGQLIYVDGVPKITSDKPGFYTTCIKDTEGQFIGETDIYDVKIFEGDIVRCLDPDGKDTGALDVIQFKNACFYLRHRSINIESWISYCDRDGDEWNGQFEVLGNIHKNMDLLR